MSLRETNVEAKGGEKIRSIAVCGLGKLGACVAAALAFRGFEVIGTDVDRSKVDAISTGRAPVPEPQLQETISSARSRLQATQDFAEVVRLSDACFFCTPTPSLPDGSFTNEYLLRALTSVAQEVRRQGKKRYLFVINSTVTPGSCEEVIRPLLEDILGAPVGMEFGLCYNPEFIALGDVINGLLRPDFVLIGESDPHSGSLLEAVYQQFCSNAPTVERMSNINAELAKISVNCAVTMKISFANQLAGVCSKIPGADPRVILGAIGKDRRIGLEYLKPGLAFGGPCFPRDNRLFQYVANQVGVGAPLAEATDQVNNGVNGRLLETVLAQSNGAPVAVLGLAYKPFTEVIDCSPGVWLCDELAKRNHKVFAHDYMAGRNARTKLPNNGQVQVCDQVEQLFANGCRTFVITCPWPEYKQAFQNSFASDPPQSTVIIDPWCMFKGMAESLSGVSHITKVGLPGEIAKALDVAV